MSSEFSRMVEDGGRLPLVTRRCGGSERIRTSETVNPPTRFRVVRLQPLGHASAPKEEGFSESVDENGNTVYVYEDSTIRVVASETRWFVPDEPKDKTGTQIWMADVTIADPSQLRTASTDALKKGGDHPLGDFSDSSKTEDVAKLAAVYNAVVAINGDSWGANGRND